MTVMARERLGNAKVVRVRSRVAAKNLHFLQPTEAQIHCAVVEYLERFGKPGVFWFHVPNGELRARATGGKLKAMGTRKGVPDLIFIKDGQTFALELKRPGQHPSADQRIAMRDMAAAGAEVSVVHGLDYALDTIREWGLAE